MIKGSIQEEDITIVNIYAPNIGAPQYIRQTLSDTKGETVSNTIIVGDLNTPLIPMEKSPKYKINTTRDKEGHYIMTKGSVQEEDITIVNIYAPNNRSTSIHKTNINRQKRRNQQ